MRYWQIISVAVTVSLTSFAQACYAGSGLYVSAAAFNSPNWQARELEFDKLTKHLSAFYHASPLPDHVDMPAETQDAVIALMLRLAYADREKLQPPVVSHSEEYSDFFSDAIELVSKIGTAKAAFALLDRKIIVTGAMATGAVARAGHLAVAPVVRRFDTLHPVAGDDAEENVYALSLLMVMNTLLSDATPPMDATDRAAIEKRLLVASQSPSLVLRRVSTRGLALLPDDAATARLQAMSKTDPAEAVTAQGIIFPVREDAADALVNRRPQ